MPASADPELARRLAVEAQRVYAEATAEMLDKVARRLAAGITEPGWAEAKLADMGRMRAQLTATLARLDAKAGGTIAKAVTQAFMSGGESAAIEVGGGFTRTSGRALDALLRESITGVTGTHDAILRSTMDRYRSIIADATTRISIGTQTRQDATSKALAEFARDGIRGFIDKAGRSWEIDTYAEMATRTASGRAAVAGSLDRYQQRGIDLVIVSNAPEECSVCRPWEGKVLSISGDTKGKVQGVTVAGTVAQARAAGLLHAQCRHNLSAYIPGLTKVPTHTADPEGDDQRQRQRALERQVRTAKRNVATQQAFVDELRKQPGAVDPAALARLQKAKTTQQAANVRLTDFVKEHDRKRLRYRESPRGGKPDGPAPTPAPRPTPTPTPKPPPPPPAARRRTNLNVADIESLKPVNSWSKSAVERRRKKIAETPDGAHLLKAVTRFQEDETDSMRKEMSKHLRGEAIPATRRHQMNALLDAFDTVPDDWKPPNLYRGMRVQGNLGPPGVGENIDLSLSSFSTSPRVAREFAGAGKKSAGYTNVIFEWEGGPKKAIPIQNIAQLETYHAEKEWMSAGRFVVQSAKKRSDGTVVIKVQQTHGLSAWEKTK